MWKRLFRLIVRPPRWTIVQYNHYGTAVAQSPSVATFSDVRAQWLGLQNRTIYRIEKVDPDSW